MLQRLSLVLFLAVSPAFPVAKEILQLQRDMALLQDQVRSLQRSLDTELAKTQQLLNQNLDAATRLSNSLAILERMVQGQEKALVGPISTVNTRVDTLVSQFQALRDAVDEMNARLSKLQQQVVDVKNIVSTVPPPSSGPPAGPSATHSATPPVQAESLFKNALRDYQTGNFNLAGPQFTDYIKYFGHTEQAADAQFYLGEIFYQQGQYDEAVDAFDQVLERYPEGKRTPDAQFKKGQAFLKQGRRDAAAREFRGVITKYPNTTAAKLAADALKGLGLSARTPPPPSKSTKPTRRR